jgi:hypothetical protein
MEYDWNWTGERHQTLTLINLPTGAKLNCDRDLCQIFEAKVLPLATTFLRGPGESVFRDIEYRAVRDILLARLWEIQFKRNAEAREGDPKIFDIWLDPGHAPMITEFVYADTLNQAWDEARESARKQSPICRVHKVQERK